MKFLNEMVGFLLLGFLWVAALAGSAGLAIMAIKWMLKVAKGGL